MKIQFFLLATIVLTTILLSTSSTFAQQLLEGTNFNIIAPNVSSGGDRLVNEDGRYEIFASLGDAISDPRIHSDSYRILTGVAIFEPNVPSIQCFETDTDGSSDCETGPSFLNDFGMTRVCGPNGCYDRARFEIDPNDNPGDTLYGIKISEDNFEEDIRYIDGTTLMPKDSRTIDDYKTKEDWETNTFNILRLDPETDYQISITALNGDFTESVPSVTAEATTALPTMEFRIGLARETDEEINYNPPHDIIFDDSFKITRGGSVVNSDELIWNLVNTNSTGGITAVQKGEHGGLYNLSADYTIDSLTGDLETEIEGIGLKIQEVSQLYYYTDGTLSSIIEESDYNTGINENDIGIIDTVFRKVYQTDGPVHTGEASFEIKTRAGLASPVGNYSEDITFLVIPKY